MLSYVFDHIDGSPGVCFTHVGGAEVGGYFSVTTGQPHHNITI